MKGLKGAGRGLQRGFKGASRGLQGGFKGAGRELQGGFKGARRRLKEKEASSAIEPPFLSLKNFQDPLKGTFEEGCWEPA